MTGLAGEDATPPGASAESKREATGENLGPTTPPAHNLNKYNCLNATHLVVDIWLTYYR
jgi:hypothetical protein